MDVSLEPVTDVAPGVLDRVRISWPLVSMTRESLQREIEALQDRGCRHVVVRRQQLLRLGETRMMHLLESAGLAISCLGFAGGFTGTMAMSYDDAVADTRKTIRLARSIGAKRVVVLPGGQGTHTYRHAEQTIRMGLADVAPFAEQHGVQMMIPTNSVFDGSRDYFRQKGCPLNWVQSMRLPAVQPMILLRGRATCRRFPRGWRSALDQGGVIRICPRCPCYEANLRRLMSILQYLDRQKSQLDSR